MATISSLTPTSGHVIIKQAPQDQNALITSKDTSDTTRLTTGTIMAVGDDYISNYGTAIDSLAEADDVVVFLTYDTKVDRITLEGEEYFHVAFRDIKSIINYGK